MFSEITDNPSDPNCPILGNVYRAGQEIESNLFTGCIRYVNKFRGTLSCEVELQPAALLDFMIAGIYAPVVSERLAEILSRFAGDDVQLFPLRINSVNEPYYVLNVISKVSCLDESRSVFKKWTAENGQPKKIGNYRGVSKLWLDPGRIGSHHCFRVDGWILSMIWSETVLRACKQAGVTGIDAHTVSD